MRERRWLLLIFYGILLATAVSGALKASRPKFKIATTSTTTSTEESPAEDNKGDEAEGTTSPSKEGNVTTGHTLTGIPQIDYIWDPNLPRELNGYNLSEYPFYNSMPEDIDFKCDGLHDGFYASVPHKCQVYHHCLYGTRYDFLCANFTAFDQKTFICHFVSEVDCVNSKKYWHRNDALYQAATTTSSTTTTTTTTTLPPPAAASSGRAASRDRDPGRRRRPFRRRPAYDYYEDYYDEEYDRGRPRGYDRREYDDYEERKYRRDRERDRDFRDRDVARPRDPMRPRELDVPLRDEKEKDSEKTPRERFPARPNRRNPLMGGRDPVEEEPRIRNRDQENAPRIKNIEDPELDDRRVLDSRTRDEDDDRYSDKRFKDDYEDKDTAPTASANNGNTEGLVKPAAPISSVYSRPRAPPKIRRPVPLAEQDRFAYKVTSTQPTIEEGRRRPVDPPLVDDYYDDELEDVRPRRPLRRRPAIRERDRNYYEKRDRDLDRPYRTRYRDDEDDVRLRKHPERHRDRFYDRERGLERSRDRSLDRGKDRTPERVAERERDRTSGGSQESERPTARPLNRERETDRFKIRTKDPQESIEPMQRPNIYERTTTSTTTTSTTTASTPSPPEPIKEQSNYERPGVHPEHSRTSKYKSIHVTEEEESTTRDLPEKYWRPTQKPDLLEKEEDVEYEAEYYDEEEPLPTLPPRATIRIVKRPFLPSRGGNPNPRGLSPVGSKAPGGKNDARPETDYREEQKSKDTSNDKPQYNAYKVIQTDMLQNRPEEYESGTRGQNRKPEENLQRRPDEPVQRRPEETVQRKPEEPIQRRPEEPIQRPEEVIHRRPDEHSQRRPDQPMQRRPEDYQRHPEEQRRPEDHQSRTEESHQRRPEELQRVPEEPPQEKATPNWSVDYQIQNTDQVLPTSSGSPLRNSGRVISVTEPPSHYYKEDQDQPTGPGNYRAKQRLNEVTRLQDIPESEYDVTLNEALTPSLNQDTNLPSGFVLPLHRQLGRDAILQSSENSFKFSRPIQQQQQQQQKSFLPSPSFVQAPPISRSNNERPKTVYYRTPETVHISGNQYRQQRGPWDYTGY